MARRPRMTVAAAAGEGCTLDVCDFPESVLEKAEPLLQRKERLLLVVVGDGDDDFIEQFSRAIDDIEVSVRDRIEAAGVNGAADHGDECRMANDECRISVQ